MRIGERNREMKFFRDKLAFTLGPAELHHRMEKQEDVMILDVRAEDDYRKGHIPGAINLPRENWESFRGLNLTAPHIVYCYSQQCHLAAAACLKLATKGLRVMELEGGMEAWRQFGYQVESGEVLARKAA